MKHLIEKLGGYKAAMGRQTAIQRTADNDHVWWLRFAITPIALLASLVDELAQKVEESEELEAVRGLIQQFAALDLYISFPVNIITEGLALPNTGRGMVLMGGPTVQEGGTVIFPSLKLATLGVEKLLTLETAREAAEGLSQAISEELKSPVVVNLDAKIAERQITNAEASQRRDARARRQEQKGGYQASQRGSNGGTSDQPAFAGPSNTSRGEDPDIPGL